MYLYTGGTVIHSNGNLLPNDVIVTDVGDLAIDTDGNVNLSCTAMAQSNANTLWRTETDEIVSYNSSSPVYQYPNGTINTSNRVLLVSTDSYQNTRFRCSNAAGEGSKRIFLYLGGSGEENG